MDTDTNSKIETDLPAPRPVATVVPWRTYLTGTLRFKFFLTGFAFPLICLVLIGISSSNFSSTRSPWQTGQLTDYVIVLTRSPAILWFYPFLAYSLVSLAMWCWQPLQYSQYAFIRLGLQTGVVLALTFMILLCVTTSLMGPIMALVVMVVLSLLAWLINRFAKKLIRFSILNLMVLTTIVAVLLALVGGSSGFDKNSAPASISSFFVLALLFICGGAPTTGLVTFIRTSVAASDLSGSKSKNRAGLIVGWIAWLPGFAATWKFALNTMLDEYAKLPTTDPNCYISSAAAFGHRRLVGGKRIAENGIVNLQMKRCKFLEFVLIACCPPVAIVMRRCYNRFGPTLARCCQSTRWFADLTYLIVKPVEWCAVILQMLLNVSQQQIARIYEP